MNQKVTELKLENETQGDILNHQQNLITNQTNDINKLTEDNQNQKNQIIEQEKLIVEYKSSHENSENELLKLKDTIQTQMNHQNT